VRTYRSYNVPSRADAPPRGGQRGVSATEGRLTESQRSGLNRRPLSRWQGLFRRLARWDNELGSEEQGATGRTAPATRAHTVPITFPESPARVVTDVTPITLEAPEAYKSGKGITWPAPIAASTAVSYLQSWLDHVSSLDVEVRGINPPGEGSQVPAGSSETTPVSSVRSRAVKGDAWQRLRPWPLAFSSAHLAESRSTIACRRTSRPRRSGG
jgi:hypothetical protein